MLDSFCDQNEDQFSLDSTQPLSDRTNSRRNSDIGDVLDVSDDQTEVILEPKRLNSSVVESRSMTLDTPAQCQ